MFGSARPSLLFCSASENWQSVFTSAELELDRRMAPQDRSSSFWCGCTTPPKYFFSGRNSRKYMRASMDRSTLGRTDHSNCFAKAEGEYCRRGALDPRLRGK